MNPTTGDEEGDADTLSFVQLAQAHGRQGTRRKGYLLKMASNGKWRKRWFEMAGHYFCYFKNEDSDKMLCSMDLHLASRPQLLPPHDGVFEFSIIYGRERIFRTNSLEDAQGWIQALEEAQGLPPRKDTLNARAALGMNVQTNPLDLDVGQEDPTAPDPGSDSKREEQPEGDDTTEPQSNPQQPHGKSSAETKPAAPPVDQKALEKASKSKRTCCVVM